MVEGDLVDLTLPTLLQALTKECSTAILRLQNGTEQGSLYFCEGALIHASSGDIVGDEAVLAVLGWSDGRFRIMRDTDQQPRTITQGISQFLASGDLHASAANSNQSADQVEGSPDERLLHELLSLLTRLEKD